MVNSTGISGVGVNLVEVDGLPGIFWNSGRLKQFERQAGDDFKINMGSIATKFRMCPDSVRYVGRYDASGKKIYYLGSSNLLPNLLGVDIKWLLSAEPECTKSKIFARFKECMPKKHVAEFTKVVNERRESTLMCKNVNELGPFFFLMDNRNLSGVELEFKGIYVVVISEVCIPYVRGSVRKDSKDAFVVCGLRCVPVEQEFYDRFSSVELNGVSRSDFSVQHYFNNNVGRSNDLGFEQFCRVFDNENGDYDISGWSNCLRTPFFGFKYSGEEFSRYDSKVVIETSGDVNEVLLGDEFRRHSELKQIFLGGKGFCNGDALMLNTEVSTIDDIVINDLEHRLRKVSSELSLGSKIRFIKLLLSFGIAELEGYTDFMKSVGDVWGAKRLYFFVKEVDKVLSKVVQSFIKKVLNIVTDATVSLYEIDDNNLQANWWEKKKKTKNINLSM